MLLTEKDFCDENTCQRLVNLGCPIYRQVTINSVPGERSVSHFRCQLYEVQKWLREEKHQDVGPTWDSHEQAFCYYIIDMYHPDLGGIYVSESTFNTYESALAKAITHTLDTLENENTK